VRRQLLEEGRVDADPVDELLDGHLLALDVVAEHLDPAAVERQQRADEADERALARPVRAEDPVDLAAPDRHAHVVDRDHRLLLAAHHEPLRGVLDEQRRKLAGGRRADVTHRLADRRRRRSALRFVHDLDHRSCPVAS
jgi:hypothetical protein